MYKWYTSSGLHVERMYIIHKKIPLPPLNSLKGLKIKPFSLFSLKISGKREEAEGLKDFFGVKNAYI